MLGTLEEGDKVRWRDHVQPLVHAYNCTKNDTTGFSPYQLMYGRQPNLPIDVAFGLNPEGQRKVTHSEYVKKLRETLEESYRLAVEHSNKTALRNKQRYDLKVRESTLQVGDRVLVKNVGIRGKHKIADKWSQTVYKVVKHIDDSPVYVVAPLASEGPERTLHRDLLLPCGFLAPSESAEVDEVNQSNRKEKTARTSRRDLVPEVEEVEHLHDSDEEVELHYPSISQDEVTYPSFTVVHDIPRTKTTLPLKLDVNPEGSYLNPTAREFHPQRVEEEEHSNTSQVPSVEADVDVNMSADPLSLDGVNLPLDTLPDETNFPVEEIDLPANVPVDEGPAVPNAPVTGEPEKEIVNTELANQSQREMREANKGDNVRKEIGLTDTNSVKDEREPEARWPTRTRREPDRLSYKYLGNPLTLVMHSILHSLDQVFTEALDLPLVPSPSPSLYTSPVINI